MARPDRLEAAQLARARARSRLLRKGLIRRRTAAAATILFAALWIAIFAQLVSGHDPALGDHPPQAAAARPARLEAAAETEPAESQIEAEAEETRLETEEAAREEEAEEPIVTSSS